MRRKTVNPLLTWLTPAWTVCVSMALPALVGAADLSMLSDFGRPDIPNSVTKGAVTTGDVAGISQAGLRNLAYIEQVGMVGNNNAESWQEGTDLAADIGQIGTSNAVRLLQSGSSGTAALQQVGIGNAMAIQQLGAGASVNSSQIGDGNQLVLIQQAGSQFVSTQTGNQNQMVVDLSSGTYLNATQTGNNWYLRVGP